MADSAPSAWHQLFVAGDASHPEALVKFQIVRRTGGVLLALPSDGRAAACALRFFDESAHTPQAGTGALALALKIKLPAGLERFSMPIEREEPFAAFLTKAAGGRRFPEFAVQAGGERALDGRFLLLVFSEKHEPVAIVKAGLGQAAADAIGDEAYFLESVSGATPGVPRLRGALRDSRVEALAIDFASGEPPAAENEAGVEGLLTAWIDTTRETQIGELFPWQMLEAACEQESAARASWSAIGDKKFHPVIYNGDFSPWHIRSHGRSWVGLNWERGERSGVPGWDWLHFVIQSSLLARRESATATAMRVERLLGSAGFGRYSEKAKISGLGRELALAYLDYAVFVLAPKEALERLRELKVKLAERFSKPA